MQSEWVEWFNLYGHCILFYWVKSNCLVGMCRIILSKQLLYTTLSLKLFQLITKCVSLKMHVARMVSFFAMLWNCHPAIPFTVIMKTFVANFGACKVFLTVFVLEVGSKIYHKLGECRKNPIWMQCNCRVNIFMSNQINLSPKF